jgi:hypothetical protein
MGCVCELVAMEYCRIHLFDGRVVEETVEVA